MTPALPTSTDTDGPDELAHLESAADVAAKALQVFGHPMTATGLVQPTAVYRTGSGLFRVLRVTPATPHSAYDQFSLMLARSRADAILTTGRNLRLEPSEAYQLRGPSTFTQGLAAWRRERLGKELGPALLVLSRGRDLDWDHPAWTAHRRVFLFTDLEGAELTESVAATKGVEVVARARPTAGAAVDFLRGELGAATIDLEAGPSTALELYDPPEVDEIQLSILDLPDPAALPGVLRGPFFLDPRRLEELFRPTPAFSHHTADGLWSFQRWTRRL